ncbi:hypothetical protein [Acetobacter pasteurianus]|uniref:Helix-turn-helix domain-containing protein n=1 Tax=Acetobacter pasteurianus subsp. pasteurianus TaxID=481145 RepID=A0A1Y0Y2Q8_ACEPA|nr:hypothetical protein [Acetobacter pasteurianus]ARW49488.1 hypothetical protein S1001342_03198 [Acetobacter pasteurianus subsp. pasteurianus]
MITRKIAETYQHDKKQSNYTKKQSTKKNYLSAYQKPNRDKIYGFLMRLAMNRMITGKMFLALNQLLFLVTTGRQSPSQRHISNISGVGLRTIQKAIQYAQSIGLLVVTPQYRKVNGHGRRVQNHYLFNEINDFEFKRKKCVGSKSDSFINRQVREKEQLSNVIAFMSEFNLTFDHRKFAIE